MTEERTRLEKLHNKKLHNLYSFIIY